MALPITPLIDLVNSIICAFCSYKIFRSYQKESHNEMLKFFSQAYLSLVFAYLFFSLPRLIVPDQSNILAIGFIFAQVGLYIAIAYFAKITAFFINVRWSQRIFYVVLLAAVITVILNIIYLNEPFYDSSSGITDWNIHPVVGIANIIIFCSVLLTSVVLFFRQGIRSHDKNVKTRSMLIACGLLLLVITAYTYYTATTETTALISDFFSLASFIVVFIGVIYKRNVPSDTSTNNYKSYAR